MGTVVRIEICRDKVHGMHRTTAYVWNENGSLMAMGVSFHDDTREGKRLAIDHARSEMRFRRRVVR